VSVIHESPSVGIRKLGSRNNETTGSVLRKFKSEFGIRIVDLPKALVVLTKPS
jgi:hypothetical protein